VKRRSLDHLDCSIARALDVIGEWWTLLVVRDVYFGVRRFDAIQENLGISRNILTDRLNTLVDQGVLERCPVERGHHEYHLTDKGRALYPVLIALMQWGDRWEPPEHGPPLRLEHECGHDPAAHLACSRCGGEVTSRTTRVRRNRRPAVRS
jgi:DNA-binding HxlR family transcriptional regulator